jgi:hypothetical protein
LVALNRTQSNQSKAFGLWRRLLTEGNEVNEERRMSFVLRSLLFKSLGGPKSHSIAPNQTVWLFPGGAKDRSHAKGRDPPELALIEVFDPNST